MRTSTLKCVHNTKENSRREVLFYIRLFYSYHYYSGAQVAKCGDLSIFYLYFCVKSSILR